MRARQESALKGARRAKNSGEREQVQAEGETGCASHVCRKSADLRPESAPRRLGPAPTLSGRYPEPAGRPPSSAGLASLRARRRQARIKSSGPGYTLFFEKRRELETDAGNLQRTDLKSYSQARETTGRKTGTMPDQNLTEGCSTSEPRWPEGFKAHGNFSSAYAPNS